jgi:hypothetical protein
MHFIGIKCETCNKLANTKDSIDDLPNGWIALVQRATNFFSTSRQEALHFCSMACLRAWVREQDAQPKAVVERAGE